MNSVTPSLLVTKISSSWLLSMVLTIYSPSPTPSLSRLLDRSVLWNRSKRKGSSRRDGVARVYGDGPCRPAHRDSPMSC